MMLINMLLCIKTKFTLYCASRVYKLALNTKVKPPITNNNSTVENSTFVAVSGVFLIDSIEGKKNNAI